MKTTRLLLAALSLSAASMAHSQVTLTASTWVPPSHALSTTQVDWCNQVTEVTASRVRCNVLAKPVTAPPGTFDAVRDGLADLSFSVHGYTPGRYVLTQLAELPFLGDSAESTSVAYQRIHEKHLSALGEHKGMRVITVFTHGPGMVINTKRAVNSLNDMDGLKFRVGGGMVNEIGKIMGINVTLRPAPQSYELLSSGVMDGVFFPAESVESFKLEKLVRHRTTFPGGLYNTSFAFVMNEATWKKISAADQAAIAKLSGEHAARMFGRAWDKADRLGAAFMQANGVEHTVANKGFTDQVRAKTDPLERKWVADAKGKGLANGEQVLRELRAEIAKLQ
jgi:TRAP-type C4-dicarboxylate transport system substrate-binding protein